jgi:hypothetical protein
MKFLINEAYGITLNETSSDNVYQAQLAVLDALVGSCNKLYLRIYSIKSVTSGTQLVTRYTQPRWACNSIGG